MSQRLLERKIAIMISAIVAAAILFSILAYQYYMRNSSDVQNIAVEHIQSTTLVKVSDLTHILKNKLDLVTVNLEILSSSQELVDQRVELGKILLNTAQKTTSNVVDFYSWVDRNGTSIWSSPNVNDTVDEKFKVFSTAAQDYFGKIKDTQVPSYSNKIKLTEGQSGILILYPIIDTQNKTITQNKTNQVFKGAILAGISSETLDNFLQGQISPLSSANLSLVDSSGMMILTGIPKLVDANVFDKKFDSSIGRSVNDNNREKNIINVFRSAVLNPRVGSTDVISNGKDVTVSYSPVISNGIHYFTIVLFLPHTLASLLDDLVVQQRNFAILAMIIIISSAIGIFFVITYWNKGLRKVVYIQTKELQETTKKLTYHDKLQKEFIDIAAHEFRTPIQSVLGYSEMIHANLKNFDQYFEKIIRNAKRLEKLTEDVLDVSRIEGKNLQLSKSYFDLNQTIKQVIEDHQKEALNKEVQIIFDSKKNIPATVYADEARLQQVIDNLLSNAINFTQNGTITITAYRAQVDTKGEIDESDRESIVVEMRDTGTGINSEMLPRLFDKFATRSMSGTGLGLYISKSIVDSHDGKIWAYNNKDGKGATFTFTLPINKKDKK
ncbi:MAG TPA: sensor histidine kinase [Nitrososphaeraceae archaeon]|nr:sensor histidine kinase [Nitrososphaeraceae archaeon]